ncbi:MAG: hypothetical protein KDN22_25850 [Verrucomicrobiae bacterium]|nr:hypothetical protein [Verrucomicrobiae bacterium]
MIVSPIPTRRFRIVAPIALLAATSTAAFEIARYTIDNGGGVSKGGTFSLRGSIGQPDASLQKLSGGAFELRGGYWRPEVIPVQTEGLPALAIRVEGTTAYITWPGDPNIAPEILKLERSPTLAPGTWNAVTTPSSMQGNLWQVTDPLTTPQQFYRLRRTNQ